MTRSPVAIFLFRRPETARMLMERVAAARPEVLFLIADGPRADRPGEVDQCRETRDEVLRHVTWPCEVVRRFSDVNLGCNGSIVGGCDFVFSHVDRAIILEDDCVPEVSFFRYCDELLDRYESCGQVMHICGYNPLSQWLGDASSYLFSHECQFAWGWASWRRAWRFYDDAMTSWAEHRRQGTNCPPWFNREVSDFFNAYGDRLPETWDYRLAYAILANSGISIVPKRNMVANVGHGIGGTHSTTYRVPEQTAPVQFPMSHPASIVPDRAFDKAFRSRFSRRFWCRVQRRLAAIMQRPPRGTAAPG
jgi:hypothetical protein